MWCATDDHSYTGHVCAKGYLDTNFNSAIIYKISSFQEIAQISHIHKDRNC